MISIKCLNQIFPQIEAIIFDKNGTIEDSDYYLRLLAIKRSRLIDAQVPGIGEPLLMAFGVNGNMIDPAGLMSVGSQRENEIAAAAYIAETGRGWIESLRMAQKAFIEADAVLADGAISGLYPHVKETFTTLVQAGLKLGIVSAAPTTEVAEFIAYHDLSSYISVAIGVDDGPSKPDPSLLLNACQTLGTTPDHTLMIGDSLGDILMAKNAKAKGAIAISWNNTREYIDLADVTITHLNQIEIINS